MIWNDLFWSFWMELPQIVSASQNVKCSMLARKKMDKRKAIGYFKKSNELLNMSLPHFLFQLLLLNNTARYKHRL